MDLECFIWLEPFVNVHVPIWEIGRISSDIPLITIHLMTGIAMNSYVHSKTITTAVVIFTLSIAWAFLAPLISGKRYIIYECKCVKVKVYNKSYHDINSESNVLSIHSDSNAMFVFNCDTKTVTVNGKTHNMTYTYYVIDEEGHLFGAVE